MPLEQEFYQRKVAEIADDLKNQGYTVLVEPQGPELPDFLAGYRPDLVAFGPEDNVVVEVKVGTETAASEQFQEIAQMVQGHPGWRFNLVVVDPQSDEVTPTSTPLLDQAHINQRLTEAEGLFRQGAKEAGFLILWLAVEALLRHIARKNILPLDRLPSSALFKELYSLGLLSYQGLNICIRGLTIRNAILHGFEAPGLEDVFVGLREIVPELQNELNRQDD